MTAAARSAATCGQAHRWALFAFDGGKALAAVRLKLKSRISLPRNVRQRVV